MLRCYRSQHATTQPFPNSGCCKKWKAISSLRWLNWRCMHILCNKFDVSHRIQSSTDNMCRGTYHSYELWMSAMHIAQVKNAELLTPSHQHFGMLGIIRRKSHFWVSHSMSRSSMFSVGSKHFFKPLLFTFSHNFYFYAKVKFVLPNRSSAQGVKICGKKPSLERLLFPQKSFDCSKQQLVGKVLSPGEHLHSYGNTFLSSDIRYCK